MSEGMITLSVLMETYSKKISMMVDFLMVKVLSAYNEIIHWLNLRMAQAVVCTYHLKVKFPTKYRVREVRSN